MTPAGVAVRRWPLALGLAAALAMLALVLGVAPVRTDLADLLPHGQTDASRLMVGELRSGAATSLILAGIEGAPEAELARLSNGLADALAGDPGFAFADNGRHTLDETQIDVLFARRYLLSPAVTGESFTVNALRAGMEKILAGLRSSASPLVQQYGLPDPTGAFPALIAVWTGASRVRTAQGVWFSAEAPARALLLVRLRASGLELAAQDAAIGAMQQDFDTLRGAGPARLVIAGPAVFARDASRAIQADVRLLAIASSVLVAGLLVWRFRSPWVLAAIAMPPVLGVAGAMLAVWLRFGFVHGITLGFGMTMIGITVDYPVLLVGHRKVGEPASGTLARIGPTFALAVLTAAIGLAGMVFAGVPGVAQLGLFAVAGILTAAAATRLLLPGLIVAAGLAPVSAGDPALLRRAERWRRFRLAGAAPVLAAAVWLAARGGPDWQIELGALTPIPAASLALDAQLRRELGAPEPGQIGVVRGGSAEEVLRREETLLPGLDSLVRSGAADGVELAARLLPSVARQRERQAMLPDPPTLAADVARAAQGLPFTADAFRPFIADVAAARSMAPLRPDGLAEAGLGSPLLAARLDALLVQRDGGWFGFIAPLGLHDPARFAALLAHSPDAVFVDIPAETNALVAGYARAAWRWLAGGAVACLLVLAGTLRDPWRVARILMSIASALVVTVAGLTALGVRLSLIHLVALPFVAGVGLDYALFFARAQVDEEERARTLRTLVTCAAMALLTFGLLAVCRTPLLRAIGDTLVAGVAAAMCFAFLFAGPRPSAA